MNTPETMRKARRHRIELIVLGMALAGGKAREEVLHGLSSFDVESDLVAGCLDSIRDQAPAELMRAFKQWGVERLDLQDIAGCLVAHLKRLCAEERAMDVLKDALVSPGSELREIVSAALAVLGPDEEIVK